MGQYYFFHYKSGRGRGLQWPWVVYFVGIYSGHGGGNRGFKPVRRDSARDSKKYNKNLRIGLRKQVRFTMYIVKGVFDMIVIRNKRAYMASSTCDESSAVGPRPMFPGLSPKKQRRKTDRQRTLKRKYGLTIEQHHQIYLDQKGCCALCGDSVAYDKIYTDHDHKTGKLRGLLCFGCNTGLGHLGDSLEGLQRAVEYLSSP